MSLLRYMLQELRFRELLCLLYVRVRQLLSVLQESHRILNTSYPL